MIRRYGNEISPEERFIKLFHDVDTDQSGEIDKNELAVLCADLGMPLTPTDLNSIMEELDTSGDGLISQDELTEWLKVNFQ